MAAQEGELTAEEMKEVAGGGFFRDFGLLFFGSVQDTCDAIKDLAGKAKNAIR